MTDHEKKPEQVPGGLKPAFTEITRITDTFCRQHLTEEYAELARKMTATLCRKRPSPLLRGTPDSWALGIVYALGRVNFLFDKSQKPHLRADELCAHFGLSTSTGASKSKAIMEKLKMNPFDVAWSLPSNLATHPTAWLVHINGFIIDCRELPRHIQEDAYARGLIPSLPPEQ
jgi:hypothetical protein